MHTAALASLIINCLFIELIPLSIFAQNIPRLGMVIALFKEFFAKLYRAFIGVRGMNRCENTH
jgi:CBS domain containing-hemolysin-like protein